MDLRYNYLPLLLISSALHATILAETITYGRILMSTSAVIDDLSLIIRAWQHLCRWFKTSPGNPDEDDDQAPF